MTKGTDNSGFPQRLRVARAAKDVTLKQLAQACGVTAQAVSKWEKGVAYPRSSQLVLACQFLGCSLDWIMSHEPIDMTNGQPTNGLKPHPNAFDPFEALRSALSAEYADLLPEGYSIYRIAEYDPEKHPAPNLRWEKAANPDARYLVILLSDWASVPALGVTVNDALKAAIAKAEHRDGTKL